jgi:hypothetical protein
MRAALFALCTLASAPASAVTVNWTSISTPTSIAPNVDRSAAGTITTSTGTVNVSFTTSGEAFWFVQGNNTGTFYWTEPNATAKPYTGGIVENAPASADIVAYGSGGTKTITFDRAVSDVYIALVSWNGNTARFTQPFEKVSEGCGYWGCGTFQLGANNQFVGSGEPHGILRFTGTFTSVSFSDTDEIWHGITVGIGGIAPPVPTPAPAAVGLLGLALAGIALRRR